MNGKLATSKPIQIQTSNLPTNTSHPYPSPLSPTLDYYQNQTFKTFSDKFTSKYILKQELGFGGFGFVYSCVRKSDMATFACKFIYKSKIARSCWTFDKQLGYCPMEVAVLKNVKHSNIIEFIEYFEDSTFCYCVTELHGALWGENGYDSNSKSSAMDLFECIEQNESFEEDKARLIFKQILSALLHLHDIGLVHRDIKDENILIDQNFHVKLIDFGSAAFFDPTGKKNFNVFLGTKQYASPEILMRQEYRGPEADVWALGCCLYIILTATIPFACLEDAMLRPFIKPNRYLHPLCLDLLQRMLEKNPSKRATLKDIHRHPWVQWNDN